MSFHVQKKLLGLQRNQIFNQGIYFVFFLVRGGGSAKRFGELCLPLKKPGYAPLTTESSWEYCVEPDAICH